MGIDITTHMDWVRTMAEVVRPLGALIRLGWVACDERQKEEGYKIWCNAYWKTELAR